MAADERSRKLVKLLDALVGFSAIVIGLTLLIIGVRYTVDDLLVRDPKASVSLSAWFEDDAPDLGTQPQQAALATAMPTSGLQIVGRVQQNEEPLANGTAKITVEKWRGGFHQSIHTSLGRDGKFQSTGYAAFRELAPGDSLVIDAEVWASALNDGPLRERIYLNSPVPTWIRAGTVYPSLAVLLILLLIFLWVFTGPNTARKNRFAIMFSYVVIFASLAAAFLAPVLFVQAIPFDEELSESTPVGIVMARLTENSAPEWMLNIGGIVDRSSERRVNQVRINDGTGTSNESEAKEVGLATYIDDERPAGDIEDLADEPRIPVVEEDAPISAIVRLRGGIQVPLYVLILSIVGGAINMARQVPKYQGQQPEGETRLLSVGATIRSVPSKLMEVLTAHAEVAHEEVSSSIEMKGSDASVDNAEESAASADSANQEKEVKPRLLDEPKKPWRIGLLDQYMFLISAPFLAIATYYLLLWLDFTQTPVIVLVSFSIGLISEPIIDAITETAASFLRGGGKTDEVAAK